MIQVEFKIDNRFKKKVVARFARHEFEAGVLKDGPHRSALPKSRGLTSVEGGPARRKSRQATSTLKQVGEIVRKVHGVDYLQAPVRRSRSKEMRAFVRELLAFATGRTKGKAKVEAALRSVIRTPIIQKKYGRNTLAWAKVKGFNRKLVDTGQFLKSILARVRRRKPNV